MKFKRR